MSIEIIVIAILAVWVLILSFYVYNIHSMIHGISKEAKDKNFIKVLEKVVKTELKNSEDIKDLQQSLDNANLKAAKHIQKVGIVRFNPFNEMGGDHSFVLALLDDYESGVLLTGLHTRERTRVYMKEVVKGKTKNVVSKEEGKALNLALKN